jgi:hypothetical protein
VDECSVTKSTNHGQRNVQDMSVAFWAQAQVGSGVRVAASDIPVSTRTSNLSSTMGKLAKCQLCGKAHHVRICKLPGAAQFRRMLKTADSKIAKKQSLNKPLRFSSQRSRGKYRKETQKAYSGKAAAKLAEQKEASRKNPISMRRQPLGDLQTRALLNSLAVKQMDASGYVQIPSKCPDCNVGSLKECVHLSNREKNINFQCGEYDCRATFSALSLSSVFPKRMGRGMTPFQVHEGIKIYTSAGISKPASPEAAAKQIGCGTKPVKRLFVALMQKEAELGTKLNTTTRLMLNVEVDGHRLRTGSIGHKKAMRLHPHLVDEWQKKHKDLACPKYWLMPIIVLGAWERGSDKGLLAPGRLKLSAPSSKPGTEGLGEVRGAAFFEKVKKNSVIFPDGAVAWTTVATEAARSLRVAHVVHKKQQFVLKDRQAKVRGASRWRGTQVLDRRWDSLDSWVGRNIATLVNGRPNVRLMEKVRSWQWRVRQRDCYTALGSACK